MLEESIDSSPNSLNSSIRRKREHRKTKRTRLNDLLLQRSYADHSQLNQLYYDDSEHEDLLLPATHGNSYKRFQAENMMAKADRCDMLSKERNLPDLTQQFYTCERLIETQGLLESFDDALDATIRNDDNTKVHFESEWILKAFEEDDMLLQANDFQDNHLNHLEQTLVPKTCDKKCFENVVPQLENNLELSLMDDWSPIENAESKTIVETILEDFCTSDSVSSEMDLNSDDFIPFFRFRRKKIRTYERCWRHGGVRRASRCDMVTYKPDDEELSDGSELSVQEGISQLHPAPEPLANLNTSNRIRNNLLNLSAFFTQNLVDSDDEAEDNSQTIYLTAPEDVTDSDNVAVNLRGYEAIRQIIMEFHTLRGKYKFFEISSSDVEDLRGFPLEEETVETEADRPMNDAIERRDVVCRSAPDLTRIYSGTNKDSVLKIADCDENSKNEQTNFDEESWHYDNDFFVNFQTQSLLKVENVNETIKIRRNSDSRVKLSTPKAMKKPQNERNFPIEAAKYKNPNTMEDEKPTTSSKVPFVSTPMILQQFHQVTEQIAADDAVESQITTDEILKQFESQKICIRKQETSKLFENDFDCMMLSEWPLDEPEFGKPASFQQPTLMSSPQSSSSSQKSIARIENIPKNIENIEQNIERKVLCGGNEEDAKLGNCFTGFQTASRKVIMVSEEAQKRIESVFANLPHFPDELNEQTSSRVQQDNAARVPTSNLQVGQMKNEGNADKCFTGFQTASKKPINVSEDARKKIESVFAQLPDLPGELNEQKSTTSDPPQSLQTKNEAEIRKSCFQTASRNVIKVSEETQRQIESVFAQLPDFPDDLNQQTSCRDRQDNTARVPTSNLQVGQMKNEGNADKCFTGFQTASKKPINVSEDARKKIESVFAQLPELPGELNEQRSTTSDPPQSLRAEQIQNENDTRKCFTGFKTASRKAINVSEEAQKRIESIFAQLPDLPKEDKTEDEHQSKIEVQGNEQIENFEDFAHIPLSEWIPNCDSPVLKQKVEIRPEPEGSLKRRLQTDNSEHPMAKIIRKSYTMNESSTHTPISIQNSESKLGRSHALNCKIIGRRNLLSLTKRRKDSLRVESSSSNKREVSEENIETPVKLLSSVWAPKNILKPHTPQAGLKPNASSTPQSMINQNSIKPNEYLDFDFKRIYWENNDDFRNNNNNEQLSVTPTRPNNSDLNKSLKPQPSPQDRIENLSSCGDPPPLPQLVDSTNRSRRLGMSRRQRGCIIKN